MNEQVRERDLVLAPNEYAFVLDETKGQVSVWVGPAKTSLAGTDRPVKFDSGKDRFERCSLEDAIQRFPRASEGFYLVLENPTAKGAENEYPGPGSNNMVKLRQGRKVNIPGPVTFPLWPGQVAFVINGHHLRSNQYLVVRVYNDEAARENWTKAVIKPQSAPAGESQTGENGKEESPIKAEVKPKDEIPELSMGKLLVIKGTDVSFYIPPTGVEVVPDKNGAFVRDAITLERLEYCILLDENGNKRYMRGPDVVFPRPTETFIERNGLRKFKAVELNELMGLYIKVIADYTDENSKVAWCVGDEMFVTGKDTRIYFPRPEHAIIKYGDQEVHFAVAIPEGEGRYTLDRLGGSVELVKGPRMFLPDPRQEVIVKRVLDPDTVRLWFPGNEEALAHNKRLITLAKSAVPEGFVTERTARRVFTAQADTTLPEVAELVSADELSRSQSFTPPRTITLDTKYEGAVGINVWTGYAVMIVSKSGNRRVILGPSSVLLEYDETLEAIKLSTGTPKSSDNLVRTVYLRVLHNTVSDEVTAETKDLCQVQVRLSYRVNFEGNHDKWFNVENYVEFLTDHLRSLIRNAVKRCGVEEFHARSIDIIRDTVLGVPTEGAKRSGCVFEENGMRVYDVEVLDVRIGDKTIENLLVGAQHEAVQQTLRIAREERNLDVVRKSELIKQGINEAETATRQKGFGLQVQTIREQLVATLAQIGADAKASQERHNAEVAKQEALGVINAAELAREQAKQDQQLLVAQQKLNQRIAELESETRAVVERAKAVSPDLVAVLQVFSERELAERLSQNLSVLSILGGKSLADVFEQAFKGTPLERVLTGYKSGRESDKELETASSDS